LYIIINAYIAYQLTIKKYHYNAVILYLNSILNNQHIPTPSPIS